MSHVKRADIMLTEYNFTDCEPHVDVEVYFKC